MIGTYDTYYSRPEVSNSDLSALAFYFMNKEREFDLTEAYRFGNLIDCLITEPHRCDHLKLRVDDEQFSPSEWNLAKQMMKAFLNDDFCALITKHSEGQKVVIREMQMEYQGVQFTLPMRCKFDLNAKNTLKISADIKSTTCTTQAQFEQSIIYFDYDKQGALYMDLDGIDKHMLIGISKKNNKVFKVPMVRDGELYNSGREKYLEWAFKYWYLFQNF